MYYSIVLTDGKIIEIRANKVEWYGKERMARLLNDKHIVARINMDNVVGWIDADYKTERSDYVRCPQRENGILLKPTEKTRCQPGSSDWLYEV